MSFIQRTLHPFYRLREIIKHQGGFKNFFFQVWYTDDAKLGNLVGQDYMGNRYYESSYYFMPRNRWVIYSRSVGFHYDASMVPPEWYGWLHHITDHIPSEDPNRPCYYWMLPPEHNLTGTQCQYVPYSTTKPKIEAWKPPPSQYPTCL